MGIVVSLVARSSSKEHLNVNNESVSTKNIRKVNFILYTRNFFRPSVERGKIKFIKRVLCEERERLLYLSGRKIRPLARVFSRAMVETKDHCFHSIETLLRNFGWNERCKAAFIYVLIFDFDHHYLAIIIDLSLSSNLFAPPHSSSCTKTHSPRTRTTMKSLSFPFPLSYLSSYLVACNKLISDKFHRSIFVLFFPLPYSLINVSIYAWK